MKYMHIIESKRHTFEQEVNPVSSDCHAFISPVKDSSCHQRLMSPPRHILCVCQTIYTDTCVPVYFYTMKCTVHTPFSTLFSYHSEFRGPFQTGIYVLMSSIV